MEDDIDFWEMEDDLNFSKMEDDLNLLEVLLLLRSPHHLSEDQLDTGKRTLISASGNSLILNF